MSLKLSAMSGTRWTSVASIGKTTLQMIQISVLARLLTPSDFGLMALVATVISFTQIVADMGVSNAIIHHQDISEKQLSGLYWANVLSGLALWILLLLSAPVFAFFYNEPRLKHLLVIAGSIFLISSIGQQIRVMAEKDLKFKGLAKVEICAAMAGLIIAILMALRGYGVLSLIIGQIAVSATTTLLLWLFISDGWRPLLHFSFFEIKHFLKFGGFVVGTNAISTLNWQIDIMLAGKIFGSTALGAYNAPRELCLRIASIINPIATRVGLPIMAKVQSDRARLKAIYIKSINMTSAFNFVFYLAMFAIAPEIVRLLFGLQWVSSIPFLRIFAIWGLFRSVGNPLGSLVYSAGRPELALKWTLFQTAIIVPLLLIGSLYSIMALAYTMLAVVIILLLASWRFIVLPLTGASFWEFHQGLCTPFILSVISTLLSWVLIYMVNGDILRVCLFIIIDSLIYGLLCMSYNKTWLNTLCELLNISNNKDVQ